MVPRRCVGTHIALYVGADKDCEGIRPRHGHVLLPPAVHHDRDVEAEHERHRDEGAEVGAVPRHLLEQPAAIQRVNGGRLRRSVTGS